MKTKSSILVTGGLGYIGSHTVVELINQGLDVNIIDNLSNSDISVLDRIYKITGIKPKFYHIDLRDLKSIAQCFQENNYNSIIHFAALKSVGESVLKPEKYYDNNIKSLENIFLSMERFEVDKLVFSSSCTVYGQPDKLPVTENSPFKKPESPYAETKQISEDMIKDLCIKNPNIKIISLRYFNPIGAHNSGIIGENPTGIPDNLVPYITQTALGKLDFLKVFGNDYDTYDGTAIRDYIHIEDLSSAHVKALNRLFNKKKLDSNFEYYNIGTGKGYSVIDVIKSFEKVSKIKLNYKILGRRDGDIEKIYANTNKSLDKLNWSANRDLDDMMKSAWKWEKKNYKKNEL